MIKDTTLRMTACELASNIAAGHVSAVEAIDACLHRLNETEPHLNAFVHVDESGARKAAQIAQKAVANGEKLGPLHGVPVSIKDLIDVKGMPARYGSKTLQNSIAAADAPAVSRLRQAGAIIIGKTTTSEFGYRGYTKSLIQGNTHNPWNVKLTPGGSSGGAVASVASGVTPIALGTDGGGSIRSPCGFTGLTGIKANFGRVPVWPASATPTLAHVGPIARDTQDCDTLLRVIAGADNRDPFSLLPQIEPFQDERTLDQLRVAYSPSLGYAQVDRPVGERVAKAVAQLNDIFPYIEQVENVCADPAEILAAEFIGGCNARLGDLVETSPDMIDPPLLDAIRQFRSQVSSDKYSRLQYSRMQHRETLRDFFETYDVLLTPTTPCLAWDINRGLAPGFETATVWSYFTYPFNLSGQPAATLPCGFSDDGLPVGLQIVVPLLREDLLCAVMKRCEAALGKSPVPIDPTDANGLSLLMPQ